MNPRIDQEIAAIKFTPQTLLMPATKEIVMDMASGEARINRTPRKIIRTDVEIITPGNIGNAIGIVETSSQVLIGFIVTTPTWRLNLSQYVGDKRQYNSPGFLRQSQKLDAVIERNFPDNLNLTSILNKLLGDKISNSSRRVIYMRYRMNLASNPHQTQTPQLVDLGILNINTFDEGSDLITTTIRITRPTYGDHWRVPNHIFGETTTVGVSEANSDYDYNYKTEFQI